jgi:hypothetical protein
MTNHIHIQLRSQTQSVSKVMSLINKRYANYFNNKYNFTGHVFEKRFFDRLINTRIGMLYAGRYIHLNPVEAGVTAFPQKLLLEQLSILPGGRDSTFSIHEFCTPRLLFGKPRGEEGQVQGVS